MTTPQDSPPKTPEIVCLSGSTRVFCPICLADELIAAATPDADDPPLTSTGDDAMSEEHKPDRSSPDEIGQVVAESLTLDGTLARAMECADQRISGDPEWTTPHYVHAHSLVEAFAVGVITADPWHQGYKLPPDFEGVVNWIAFNIQRRWAGEVVQVSLREIEGLFMEWGGEHPSFKQWNETDKLVGVVSRYTPTPGHRDFIDLHALVRNAAVHVRNEWRRTDAFDADFDKRWTDGEKAQTAAVEVGKPRSER